MMLRCVVAIVLAAGACLAQSEKRDEPLRPAWCRELPRPQYKNLTRVDSADPWFEVYRIRPGVFAIYEPHQFEEVISYLIVGSQHALLFDTGIGVGNIRKVVSGLTAQPVTVLNSHTHYDHVGGNADFAEILGVDSDYSRKNAAGQANAYAAGDALAPDRLCGALPDGVTRDSYKIRPWRVTRTVHDGEQIELGGRTLEVLLTPGHTPDSLMLLDRKNRLLFTGDMFYRGPIYLYVPETDMAAYEKSIERVAALAPQLELLLPSHNTPLAEPAYLGRVLDAFRDVQARRVKPVLSEGYAEYKFDGFSLLMKPDP
jgi:glyoxylase-like metal-dependent hydrolase (beta-lactamase superfamily II)